MEPVTAQLIKSIKHLMVDKGVEIGHRVRLLEKISEKLGRPIHRNTLYNALSGYRSDNKSGQDVLTTLHGILEDMPDKHI